MFLGSYVHSKLCLGIKSSLGLTPSQESPGRWESLENWFVYKCRSRYRLVREPESIIFLCVCCVYYFSWSIVGFRVTTLLHWFGHGMSRRFIVFQSTIKGRTKINPCRVFLPTEYSFWIWRAWLLQKPIFAETKWQWHNLQNWKLLDYSVSIFFWLKSCGVID